MTPPLGLKRHTVRVAPYDEMWPLLAANAIAHLKNALGENAIDIQHVGSTAVPGLSAKPVIDLAVLVSSLSHVPTIAKSLRPLGWTYLEAAVHEVGHLFVLESEPDVRSHHLHVVERGELRWDAYIRFRDALRKDPALRDRYAQLKNELAARHPTDRKSYTQGKDELVRAILAQPS